MGASGSKTAARAGSAARKYPSRIPNHTSIPRASQSPPTQPSPAKPPRQQPQVSDTRNEAINLDGMDPAFAAQLRSIGAVSPAPHFSNSSIAPNDPHPNRSSQVPFQNFMPDPRSNPALAVLSARQRIQDEAEEEQMQLGTRGFEGRRFIDAATINRALVLRKGRSEMDREIEARLGLRKGILDKLDKKGIVESI